VTVKDSAFLEAEEIIVVLGILLSPCSPGDGTLCPVGTTVIELRSHVKKNVMKFYKIAMVYVTGVRDISSEIFLTARVGVCRGGHLA
jgi:hypothetical protein